MHFRSKEGLLLFAPFCSQDGQESLLMEQNEIKSTQNETRSKFEDGFSLFVYNDNSRWVRVQRQWWLPFAMRRR